MLSMRIADSKKRSHNCLKQSVLRIDALALCNPATEKVVWAKKGSKAWNVLSLVVERIQITATNLSSLLALNHMRLLGLSIADLQHCVQIKYNRYESGCSVHLDLVRST